MREFIGESLEIPNSIMRRWQKTVDLLAKLSNVPAALIMRVVPPYIEVFKSSHSAGNPYKEGEQADFFTRCGLYCEHVIRTGERLLVPNALKDEEWKDNPDVALNMISYLGYPIQAENDKVFGTLCVLDSKENSFSPEVEELIVNLKQIIEAHLELLFKNRELEEAANKINTLSGLLPICANCKNIRDDKGYWERVDVYLSQHSDIAFTHGLCPDCITKLYGEYMGE